MKCHQNVLRLLSLVCTIISMAVACVYEISTTCASFPENISDQDIKDGSDIFNISIEHYILDPYLDILPNVSYTVLITQIFPDIVKKGLYVKIKEHNLQGFHSEITAFDDKTKESVSQDLICSSSTGQESLLSWTSYVYRRCFNISAVILLENSTLYHVSTIICRSPGNRSYHGADIRGYITSPGFPLTYPDNTNLMYIIFSMKKSSIHLQYQSFNLESSYRGKCFDAVTVISDTTDIICGSKHDADLENLYYQSNTGKIMVKFITDNKLGDNGFNAVFYTLDTKDCNKSVTLPRDNITSIYYPDVYLPNMKCVVSIKLPQEYRIQLTIRDIDIEMKTEGKCFKDSLQLTSKNFDIILCGNWTDLDQGQYVLQSSSSTVDIIFTSNYLHEMRGFWIEYSSHIPCSNQTFTNLTGTLYSDNYPSFYSNNQDCFYTIQLSESSDILELTFESFNTEASHNSFVKGELCNLDYIELYLHDKVERICGQWKGIENSLSYRSDIGSLTMRFVTNHNVTRSGFFATWHTTSVNESLLQCDSSWIEREQSVFEIVRNRLTWEEGKADCQQKGGLLAAVRDLDMQFMFEENLSKSENCSLKLDAFWIGANDITTENYFRWNDGDPLSFTYWFPGWKETDFRNKQPSDDGWTGEDCVEMRKSFYNTHKGVSDVSHYYWNDRQCNVRNPYICQFNKNQEEPTIDLSPVLQNYMYELNSTFQEIIISSPGFPQGYPMSSDINIIITVPLGNNIVIDFYHFNLEYSKTCEYDNLTLSSQSFDSKTTCGNWNTKLKKINWISETNSAVIRFTTDASINRSGFSFKASLYTYHYCDRRTGEVLNVKSVGCIMLHLQERVTYQDAEVLCQNQNGTLMTNISSVELFLIKGFALSKMDIFPDTISFWYKNTLGKGNVCEMYQLNLTVKHQISRSIESCEDNNGFVCKWNRTDKDVNVLQTKLTSSTGELAMMKDENEEYTDNRNYTYIFTAPKWHQIVIELIFFDVEYQAECLYDALYLYDFHNVSVLCGNITVPQYFTSISNYAEVSFKTDENILGLGFKLRWRFVDTVTCFDITRLGGHGSIKSFNFLHPFTDHYQCCSEVHTAFGSRIIINVDYIQFSEKSSCVSIIHSQNGKYRQFCGDDAVKYPFLSKTVISTSNSVSLCFQTSKLVIDDGFRAKYKVDGNPISQIVDSLPVSPNSSGVISSPHFPESAPAYINYTTALEAPVGNLIELNIEYKIQYEEANCTSSLHIMDDTLGKDKALSFINVSCGYSGEESVVIQSYLNKLKIVFSTGNKEKSSTTHFNATYKVLPDASYLDKTRLSPKTPFTGCTKGSCLNNGYCKNVSRDEFVCLCPIHYTGMFCQVTWCDLPVCKRGRCILDNSGYHCHCEAGYWGKGCNMSSGECAVNVCSGNGVCIDDTISGKLCSCNKDWIGESCNEYLMQYQTTPSSRTLMDEPIWIGMIVVLILLFLFGILFLSRRRCSQHFKCCEDTNEILKKQAENAIPAHKNYIPSPHGTLSNSNSPVLHFKFDQDVCNETRGYNNFEEEIQTPPINVENIGAAARLFEAYNSKSEKPYIDKQSIILNHEPPTVSGIVDGKLQFLRSDNEHYSSDTDNIPHFTPFAHSELRKSFTSLPAEKKDREYAFTKSKSLHEDFEHRPHCYPNIVIMNDSSNDIDKSTDARIVSCRRDRKKSIQRQKTLDESDAKRKREVFASKSKSTSTRLELPFTEPRLIIKRACSNQEDIQRSSSLTPTSFESDPTYWVGNRRFRKVSASSEDDISDQYITRSYSSQLDRVTDLDCKCCGRQLDAKSSRHRKPKHYRLSRKRHHHHHHHQQRLRSAVSEQSNSFESCQKGHKNCREFSSQDVGYCRKDYRPRDKLDSYTVKQRSNDIAKKMSNEVAKKVSLHIIQGNQTNEEEYRKVPVRKSRSNDLNLNKASMSLLLPKPNSPFRKRSHSFHSETSDSKRSNDPDDQLNESQKSSSPFYHGLQQNESNLSKYIALSPIDRVVLSGSSVLSITDTDTGFSSSSPWREHVEDITMEQNRTHPVKDSAYQTKQSSVDRHQFETPRNSYENPEDVKSDEQDMTKKLQQAAQRLVMYEKNTQFSKDSAFNTTFSEADDTSCDSDTSGRDTHTAVRPRSGNFNFLHPKLFPLEQVSEECDSNTLDSVIVNDETNIDNLAEEIEMKEFNR